MLCPSHAEIAWTAAAASSAICTSGNIGLDVGSGSGSGSDSVYPPCSEASGAHHPQLLILPHQQQRGVTMAHFLRLPLVVHSDPLASANGWGPVRQRQPAVQPWVLPRPMNNQHNAVCIRSRQRDGVTNGGVPTSRVQHQPTSRNLNLGSLLRFLSVAYVPYLHHLTTNANQKGNLITSPSQGFTNLSSPPFDRAVVLLNAIFAAQRNWRQKINLTVLRFIK